ncbi:unnamed protein product [Hapterophycus canaliculatus]
MQTPTAVRQRLHQVVRARYGLDGANSKTLEEIGREMGFTRERVRQIEAKALAKLRQPYRNYRVREHKVGQIFVDAGLREPASEAVSAARALIAEAERLEKQQPAVAAARVEEPGLAAAGDRPLKIEFKPGVDASESTQAVEAVLVAALDRTPTTAAAPASSSVKRNAAGVNQASGIPGAEVVGRGGAAGSKVTAAVGGAGGSGAGVGASVGAPAASPAPGSKRVLLDVESKQGSAKPGSTHVDANRLGDGSGSAFTAGVERSPTGADVGASAAAAALTPEEQRALEIESKRKSLDKAWNKKSEAAVDRLERELAQSAAALATLEGEQEEWERSVGSVVAEKSLSMASL